MAEKPPRRPKRVSLKGRGADIFFGDYTPPGGRPSEESPRKPANDQEGSAPEDRLHDSSQTGYEEGGQAASLQSKQASHQIEESSASADPPAESALTGSQVSMRSAPETTPASSPAPRRTVSRRPPQAGQQFVDVTPDMAGEIWSLLDMHATIANTFRYTEEELTALSDVLYQLSSEQKVRVTKQEAARMGLYLVLEDYRRRGSESLLGQLAASRRFRRTGGR